MSTMNKNQFNPLKDRLKLPVNVGLHYHLSLILIGLGFFLTCWFLLYMLFNIDI
jgi:hypothetical protein